MKKVTLLMMMVLMGLTGYAQTDNAVGKFGYFSCDSVMRAMPEYANMESNLAQLRAQYDAEMKRVENDLNKKYEEFLDGQKNFPKTILQKRQSELQEMLDKNIAFKKQSKQLLTKAEADAKAPLQARIAEVLNQIGLERGYAFILNTDVQSAAWMNPSMGEDITEAVKAAVNN